MQLKSDRNLDAEYVEVTYGMLRNFVPSRYRAQIVRWECTHCDFALSPERSKGNFGRVSHGRAEMRKHIRQEHP